MTTEQEGTKMKEIILTNSQDYDDFGIVPFPAHVKFKQADQTWYTDGAIALNDKYIKVDERVEIDEASKVPRLINEYSKYTRLKLIAFDRGRFIFRGGKEKPFYTVIQAHYMATIYAISTKCELFAKDELSAITIEANIEAEIPHNCDCEFCYKDSTAENKKHLIGIVMPIQHRFSDEDIQKLERMSLEEPAQ